MAPALPDGSDGIVAEDRGFTVAWESGALLLVDRRTEPLLRAAWILTGLAALLGLLALVLLAVAGAGDLPFLVPAILLVLGGGLGWFAGRAWRAERARDTSGGRRLRLKDGRLLDGAGGVLAVASAVRLTSAVDLFDGTGGLKLARRLRLHWAGGSAVVFKSFDADLRDKVASALRAAGIP